MIQIRLNKKYTQFKSLKINIRKNQKIIIYYFVKPIKLIIIFFTCTFLNRLVSIKKIEIIIGIN